MKFKTLLCWGIALSLVCSGLPQGMAYAQEAPSQEEGTGEEEETSAKLSCELLEDGTWEVSADAGEAYGELVIPAEIEGSKVSRIAPNGFAQCDTLTKVTILAELTEIGGSAFQGCKNLQEVAIPGSVQAIGSFAFDGCSALTRVELPEGLAAISSCALDRKSVV